MDMLFSENEELQISSLQFFIRITSNFNVIIPQEVILRTIVLANSQNFHIHNLSFQLLHYLTSFSPQTTHFILENGLIDTILIRYPFEETIDIISNLIQVDIECRNAVFNVGLFETIQREITPEVDDELKLKFSNLLESLAESICPNDPQQLILLVISLFSFSIFLLSSNNSLIVSTTIQAFCVFIEKNIFFGKFFVENNLLNHFLDHIFQSIKIQENVIELFLTLSKYVPEGDSYLFANNIFVILKDLLFLDKSNKYLIYKLLIEFIYHDESIVEQLVTSEFFLYAVSTFEMNKKFKEIRIEYDFITEIITNVSVSTLNKFDFSDCFMILIKNTNVCEDDSYSLLESLNRISQISNLQILQKIKAEITENETFLDFLLERMDDNEEGVARLAKSFANFLEIK